MRRVSRYLTEERPAPREGTALREMYDRLLAGETVRSDVLETYRRPLRDYHGFELEAAGNGESRAVGKLTVAGQMVRIWPKGELS